MSLSRRDLLLSAAAAALPPALLKPSNAPAAAAGEGGAVAPRWSLPPKRPFKVVENEWITLKEGTRLAARLWIPDTEGGAHAPVVLEYLPYRKRDVTRRANDATGQRLAQYGIGYARVDIRGSGDSDGLLRGEYTKQEQSDGLEVIAWLAAQPWSNGAVGMRGISWGGFNTLQIAALAPPQLKAIMPACFTDNQFTDDAHYYGGALSNPNFYWGVMFQSVLGAAPDPQIVGDRWRKMWMQRLEDLPPIHAEWTRHQRFDDHWKTGSVAVDYSRIQCAVYAVGGLNDHYINVNARVMAHLQVPCKSIIGPWAHDWPDGADPGPSLEWVQEEVRWWHHWLKGVDTGIMDEPMFRVYVCEKTAVEVYPEDVPGHWVAEETWPSPNIKPTTFFLNPEGLSDTSGEQRSLRYKGDRIVGTLRGEPDAFFFPMDLPQEQSPDDERSLTFDSQPLSSDLEVVGNPVLKVRVSADVPVAKLAVRLTQVTPEGKSWAFTMGLLNLTHRVSHEEPRALEPGRSYDVEVPLTFTSMRLKAGNRLRVALSENFWPLVWPSPKIATLTVTTGISSLVLPVRTPKAAEDAPRVAVMRNKVRDQVLINGRGGLQVRTTGPDAKGSVKIEKIFAPRAAEAPDIGTVVTRGWTPAVCDMQTGAPNSCKWTGGFTTSYRRADWNTSIHGAFEITSTPETFHVKEFVRATEGDQTVFERHWDHAIKRDLM
jgi:putative CocE/NonD family hydrolase